MTDLPIGPAPAGHRLLSERKAYRLHRYASPGEGSVNSYVIETADALILFDAQRQRSQARAALSAIRRLGKPIAAIVISHEHPDHVGGLDVFMAAAPDAPVYAAGTTAAEIRADRFGYFKMGREAMGEDVPETPPVPSARLEDGERLEIGGLTLTVRQFGQGEAAAMTGLILEEEALVADLVVGGMTPFILDGHLQDWLRQLDRCQPQLQDLRCLYPGHGHAAAPEALFTATRTWLETLRDQVAQALQGRNRLDNAVRDGIVTAMEQRFPGYLPVAEVPDLLQRSVEAAAKALAG